MSAGDTSREYPERPFVAVSLALFRDGRALVASRALTERGHLYSLPGGMVETGESLADAALRELHEEVGLRASAPVSVGPVEIIERDGKGAIRHHIVLMVHAARWQGGEARTGPEALDIRWVFPEEIDGLHATPRLAEIVGRARMVLERTGVEEKSCLKPEGK